jgi:oligoendopeptidase F
MNTETAADRWDLSAFFPGPDSSEFHTFVDALRGEVAEFSATQSTLNPHELVRKLEELQSIEARRDHLYAYVAFEKAVAPMNELVLQAENTILDVAAGLEAPRSRLLGCLRALTDGAFDELCRGRFAPVAHTLRALRQESARATTDSEEGLIAALAMDGLHRWARLAAFTLAGTVIAFERPDGTQATASLSEKHELLWGGSAASRKSVYAGITAAVKAHAPVLANCMNGAAGFELSVAERRGRDLVDGIMRRNAIDRSTVDLMMECVKATAPRLHRYLAQKARLLGLDAIGIQDRSAPLDDPELSHMGLTDARRTIVGAFAAADSGLAAHASDMFLTRKIEASLRPGRQPGGFCMASSLLGESRIYMNYGGSFNSVCVLAHELGHAYHNHVLCDLPHWRQMPPATLAETAAILCEHLTRRSVYMAAGRTRSARRAALASQLDSAVNYLLRIPRDYEFELTFLAARADHEVTVSELCSIMRNSHAAWFGSALAGDDGDAWGWAHNHIMLDPGLRLYNFPYTLGFLLSTAIADRYAKEGPAFGDTYKAFLEASTAMSVEDAVRSTLGYELREASFWNTALDRIVDDAALLERLSSDG